MATPPVAARPAPPPPTPEQIAARRAEARQMRMIILSASALGLLVLAVVVTGLYFLLRPETSADEVARIRDVFIIVVGFETLIIGAALVILLVQLASLINLLQNEVRPILEATSETVNSLRGTAQFLGENVVEPVIKLNGYLASMQRVLELMGLKKK
jgi:hypothetical protein